MRYVIFLLIVLSSSVFGCDKSGDESVRAFAKHNDLLISDNGEVIEIYFPAVRDSQPLRTIYLSIKGQFGGLLLLSDSKEYAGYKFIQATLGSEMVNKVEVTPGYEAKTTSLCVVQEPSFKLTALLKAVQPKITGKRY